jgi:hypothetical protein
MFFLTNSRAELTKVHIRFVCDQRPLGGLLETDTDA